MQRSQGEEDTETYHAVNIGLFIFVVDGGEEGSLVNTAFQSCGEVDGVRVIVVVTEAVFLPPAGITATFRS